MRVAQALVGRLSEEQVRSLLAAATRAPSLHNSQPWRFPCTSSAIELYADTRYALPATDPDNRELTLACAATLLRDGTTAFTEHQLATATTAGSGIAERIAHAMVLGHAGTASSEVGTLWLDETGRLLSATHSAHRWLATAQLESVLAGLAIRAAAQPAPLMVRVRLAEGWVTLHAERLIDTEGQDQGIVVVIQPAHPGGVLPLAVAAFGLTPREADVTKAVLGGKDTRSTSAALGISPYTVQDHLKSVFTKVGVTSRGELAHRLALHLV